MSFGFAGEWTDQSGMQYLRARYYDPSVGRFVSRDGWEGNVFDPYTLNRWNYGFSNPVRYTDLAGNFPPGYCVSIIWAFAADGPLPIGDATVIGCLILAATTSAASMAMLQQLPEVQEELGVCIDNWIEWMYYRPYRPEPDQTPTPRPGQIPSPIPVPIPLSNPPRIDENSNADVLYHYTKMENLPSIISTGLKPSIRIIGDPKSDAQWGDGQYLTDLTPLEASSTTRYKVSIALFNMPWKFGSAPNSLFDIGWIGIDVSGLN